MNFATIAELDDYLSQLGLVHLYIREYRITHSYLHLSVAGEHFHDVKCNIYLTDCTYLCGPPQGGPWRLRASELVGDGDRIIEIAEDTRRFFVRGLRVHVVDKDEPQAS
jgi:hypothetical protein